MKRCILSVVKGDYRKDYIVDKERFLIGRDERCDVILEDSEVSKEHVMLHMRLGSVYIENVSLSGQVYLEENFPVEYVEVGPEREFIVGPFRLSWAERDVEGHDFKTSEEEPAVRPQVSGSEFQSEIANVDAFSPKIDPVPEMEAQNQNAQDAAHSQEMGEDSSNENNAEEVVGFNKDENSKNQFEAGAVDSGQGAADLEEADPNAGTQIMGAEARAVLKVIKGEQTGREIKLDFGFQWTVGRSSRSHIQIQNTKLSRQHFKIVKIGKTYRLQDLGSSHSTKLNGVTVSDAPLNSFDTIQAGPVELQFLLVDPARENMALSAAVPALGMAGHENPSDLFGDNVAPEKTNFAPPAPYVPEPTMTAQAVNLGYGSSGQSWGSQDQNISSSNVPVKPWVAWRKKFEEIPRERRILLGLFFVLLVGGLFYKMNEPTNEVAPLIAAKEGVGVANQEQKRNPASETPKSQDPISESADVSPEFKLLSGADQNRVKENYALMERAYQARKWKDVIKHGAEVRKLVSRYRAMLDMITEAQAQENDSLLGALNQTTQDIDAANAQSKEKIDLYVSEGEKALKDARFDDAKAAFEKAMLLDPKNESATKGFAAAVAKDPSLLLVLPDMKEDGAKAVEVDPDLEAKQMERDELEAMARRFQSAKQDFMEGKVSESLVDFRRLEGVIKSRISGYRSGTRGPASIRGDLLKETTLLQSKVQEGVDAAVAKLRADYQVQMADAEQLMANRNYAMARDIYDRILAVDPQFEDAQDARKRLYAKALSEARSFFQEGIIYESVGDLDSAVGSFEKVKDLLANIDDSSAQDYYSRALTRLSRLRRTSL